MAPFEFRPAGAGFAPGEATEHLGGADVPYLDIAAGCCDQKLLTGGEMNFSDVGVTETTQLFEVLTTPQNDTLLVECGKIGPLGRPAYNRFCPTLCDMNITISDWLK